MTPLRLNLHLLAAAVLAAGVVPGGCGTEPARPPQTPAEYSRHLETSRQEFTSRTIALHNARRVLSPELSEAARLDSLKVIEGLNSAAAETHPMLAGALAAPDLPPKVRAALLAFLGREGYPDLAAHMAEALPQAADPAVRKALLDWFGEHPSAEGLTEVVKLWARERELEATAELKYRRSVEMSCKQPWDEALLARLNAPEFQARGSALEVLATRVPYDVLCRRIEATPPRTEAVRILQYFLDRFGGLPATRQELLAAVWAHRRGVDRLRPAEQLAAGWREGGDYNFNVRDLHLLASLAADPLRPRLARAQLALEIKRGIAGRTPAGAKRPALRRGRVVGFSAQAESLSTADLWLLLLIDEMLRTRPFQQALTIAVRQDRQDTRSRWAGLIFYEHGRAALRLYDPEGKRGDDRYVPSGEMLRQTADCLAWFVNHFGADEGDPSKVGPDDAELAFARQQNVNGVVFTTLAGGTVNTIYFNPAGKTVDLGDVGLGE